jgi:peptidoglycan/LPS O-acetylase OafA/YrhL
MFAFAMLGVLVALLAAALAYIVVIKPRRKGKAGAEQVQDQGKSA